MKTLMVSLALLISTHAFAKDPTTCDSKGHNTSPIAFADVQAQVQKAVTQYRSINSEVGEIQSWTCTVQNHDANPANYVDQCVVILDLPSDWDYYGAFKLTIGFDPYNQSITRLNYEWIKTELN